MKKFSLPNFKIDWPNHLIGFFSALFGILIAFELDEWRERQNQQELATKAFDRMKVEIDLNQNILHANVKENLDRLSLLKALANKLNDNLLFTGTNTEADSINRHFSGFIYIDTQDGHSASRAYPAHIGVSSITTITQHASAWESAKATGVLNFMGYEKVIALSSIYNYSNIIDELQLIRQLTKNANDIKTKTQLLLFLFEMEESLHVIQRELNEYDQFVNMLEALE